MPDRSSTGASRRRRATGSSSCCYAHPDACPNVRADIQGLRAVAVGSVLAYHLWPGAVAGGYVGVDVFLVISGYLITSHLLRERPDRWRAVGRFWGRRVRRLLPASALVVLVTVLVGAVVLPSTQLVPDRARTRSPRRCTCRTGRWPDRATDYLAAEDAPTALRHYWSLAVEEQFYLVWPVLVGLWRRWSGGRWPGGAQRSAAAVPGRPLAGVGRWGCWSDRWPGPPTSRRWTRQPAYYVTTTRGWELALGGALALAGAALPRAAVPSRWSGPLSLAGLAAILLAVLTFDGGTPFPGTAALLPTLGTVAVIAAESAPGSWAGRLLGHPARAAAR